MDNLLKLWDGMFAEDSTLKIVDYVCLSMLLRVRDDRESFLNVYILLVHSYGVPIATTRPHSPHFAGPSHSRRR